MAEDGPTVVIAATFSAEPVEESLSFWLKEFGVSAKIEFAPFNQVVPQLLDPKSLVRSCGAGLVVLLIRLEDWIFGDEADETGSESTAAEQWNRRSAEVCAEFVQSVALAMGESSASYLICICPAARRWQADDLKWAIIREAERGTYQSLQSLGRVRTISPESLLNRPQDVCWHDPESDEIARIPYTPLFFAALGTTIVRHWHATFFPPYKVIAFDADQTLWKGVCAEDGVQGIQVDAARRQLQEFLVARYREGKMLCLCSKNAASDVEQVFAEHPDMVLRREDLVSSRVGWQPKSASLKSLSVELRVSLDSVVFLDDDSVEVAEVRAACPEVLALALPTEPSDWSWFLENLWALDPRLGDEFGVKRTGYYRDEAQRRAMASAAPSLAQYIEGLALSVRVNVMTAAHAARVSELTYRTTQFNPTAEPWTEREIVHYLDQAGHAGWVAEVSDRFGDYGLVGAALTREAGTSLCVDALVLSCRALGRGVEHRIWAHLGSAAKTAGLLDLRGRYRATNRNRPAQQFLASLPGLSWLQQEAPGEYLMPAESACAVRFDPGALPALRDAKKETGLTVDERISPSDGGGPSSVLDFELATLPSDRQESVVPSSEAGGLAFPNRRIRALERVALGGAKPDAVLRALRSLAEQPRPRLDTPFESPEGDYETVLADLWCEVLRLREVGRNDSFFELGGHSILIIQVISRIRDHYGVEVPIQKFFEEPTVAALARAVSRLDARGEAANRDLGNASRAPVGLRDAPIGLFPAAVRASVSSQGVSAIDIEKRGDSASTMQRWADTSITSVGFPTSHRPLAMKRALSSYLDHTRKHGRQLDFIVMDDSRSADAQALNRQLSSDLRRRGQAKIGYGGRPEKEHYVACLARHTGVEERLVRWALLGEDRVSYLTGANRNALLLQTVGETSMSVDDDTVCRLGGALDRQSEVSLSEEVAPEEHWFHESLSSALAAVSRCETDWLGAHELLLGRQLAQVRLDTRLTNRGEVEGRCSGEERGRLSSSTRIPVTVNGLAGDCAWGSPFGWWGAPMGYLLLEGGSRHRLVGSELNYRAACASRAMVRSVLRPTIAPQGLFLSATFGLDNRDLVPPFPPSYGGEDVVMQAVYRACRPDFCVGYLPLTLDHCPEERRQFRPGEIFRSASGFDMAKLLIVCIRSWHPAKEAQPLDVCLRQLGAHFQQLGDLELNEFCVFVREEKERVDSIFLGEMEASLARHQESPVYWANDLKKYMDILRTTLDRKDQAVPQDVRLITPDVDGAWRQTQDFLRRYGELLCHWPDFVAGARELRARGARIADIEP